MTTAGETAAASSESCSPNVSQACRLVRRVEGGGGRGRQRRRWWWWERKSGGQWDCPTREVQFRAPRSHESFDAYQIRACVGCSPHFNLAIANDPARLKAFEGHSVASACLAHPLAPTDLGIKPTRLIDCVRNAKCGSAAERPLFDGYNDPLCSSSAAAHACSKA